MYCTSTITNWWIPFRLLANCFLFFCRDSAVLAELIYPIQNQVRVPAQWVELYMSLALSILIL